MLRFQRSNNWYSPFTQGVAIGLGYIALSALINCLVNLMLHKLFIDNEARNFFLSVIFWNVSAICGVG
ncbi:MAG: hypothetical protein LBU83_01785 [Bacteroidales bacterium]|jgi:hypothetical protein|nr:hypothetical protein [Bacteroidales bacterium]